MNTRCRVVLGALVLLVMPSVASAQTAPPAINQADTAWMLIATALVLLMTPALAFFYGGLVRSKNALNTMMMSFISLGFVGVLWAVVGYSLAFAPAATWHRRSVARVPARRVARTAGNHPARPVHGLSGHLRHHHRCPDFRRHRRAHAILRLRGCSSRCGRCSSTARSAHWVWGGGWLAKLGALDFAGGTVVHVNAAIAALVAALVVGKRQEYPSPRSFRTTCRSRFSAPGCCGSAGSVSTPAARWRPTTSPAWRS